ncbi:hypothetical protein [Cellulomonas phragmiteti]|uniref:Uncharacterized protein n=1 Tax=Cellulomonas phragmiteti TaxID=478780 RepID=A0ABQ4DN01_9CELL|nr:hypothetical protein [Cellulomonas phragmiteti]GIG40734.1 hypothetical protein Cph01nite_24960 [Cellulomonas phragmiteti]
MTHELQVTTSPRSTWLWAASDADAAEVRALLDAGAHFWVPAYRYGNEVARVTDVEIGATALDACETLTASGWVLRWHPDQHPLNRRNTLLGLPIAQPE